MPIGRICSKLKATLNEYVKDVHAKIARRKNPNHPHAAEKTALESAKRTTAKLAAGCQGNQGKTVEEDAVVEDAGATMNLAGF